MQVPIASAVSWSTVALATGPAAVTGALGYLGARLQSRASVRQAEVVLDQQTGQHAEEHLRHRQVTYQNLLDETRRLDWMLVSRDARGLDEWWSRWAHEINGAYLYGTDAVRAAAEKLSDFFGSMADMSDREIADAYPGRRPEYRQKFYALVDAMREDVAPRALRSADAPPRRNA